MKKLQRTLLPLFAVMLLLVSGCRGSMDLVINPDNTMTVKMDMGLTSEEASAVGVTADQLCDQMEKSRSELNQPGVEMSDTEKYEEGGLVGCRVSMSGPINETGSKPAGGGLWLEDDVWHFELPPDDTAEEMPSGMDIDFRFSITFPGEVLSKSGSATVEGNTVIWTDMNELAKGLEASGRAAEGAAAPGNESSAPEQPAEEASANESGEQSEGEAASPAENEQSPAEGQSTTAAQDGDGGFPTWAWALVAALGAAAIATAVWLMMRGNKKDQGQQGFGQQPYAQPGYDQNYNQGYNPGQPDYNQQGYNQPDYNQQGYNQGQNYGGQGYNQGGQNYGNQPYPPQNNQGGGYNQPYGG